MSTFFVVLFAIVIVVALINRMVKTGQQFASAAKGENHSKCHYCGSRLKSAANRFGYAESCPKCGRAQPWAKDVA